MKYPALFLSIALAAVLSHNTHAFDVNGRDSVAHTSITWTTLGNSKGDNGKPHYTQRFVVKGNLGFPAFAFNQFARGMKVVNPQDTLTELVPGYYRLSSPRLEDSRQDSVIVDIEVNGTLLSASYAPDGLHLVDYDATTAPVKYTRNPIVSKEQWAYGTTDRMPYGPAVYQNNTQRETSWIPGAYDIVPRPKSVTMLDGYSRPVNIGFETVTHQNPEYYRVRIQNDSIIIGCNPRYQWAVMRNIASKVLMPNEGNPLPNAVIESWPDLPYRGLHIDIARNFQTPKTLNTILELMNANMLNVLHFHFADDEAWRLEIPGLPELTELGSRRGYSTDNEHEFLYQIFAGDGNADNLHTSSNGHWTREEFIDFLRRANAFGITVLPEIESPGHARAAIKAMEKRYRNGDDKYRLIHDGDTSKYTSAQAFHDNVMNPALPGPYTFMDKVFEEIVKMYAEAEAPLPGIHIGGDEVPQGSWNGSAAVKQFMVDNGMSTEKEVHAYFVRRIAQLLKDRNVPMFGWEEIAVGHGSEFNSEIAPLTGGVNCWHTTPDAAIKAAKSGFPVILSNVNRFYLDMSYDYHPEEPGLTWGGTVDEFDALGGYMDKLCPVDLDSVPGKVIGVSGQVWAETIRTPQDLYYRLLPKMMGLAERGWNTDSTYTEAEFNAIIGLKELPNYTRDGMVLSVRLRPAGIIKDGNMVKMNAPYPGGTILYTTDGTDPDSPLATDPSRKAGTVYTAPFPFKDGMQIRARYYCNNTKSTVTYLE